MDLTHDTQTAVSNVEPVYKSDTNYLKIGIVGSHMLYYNHDLIKKRIIKIMNHMIEKHSHDKIQIVTGVINSGISNLACVISKENNYMTIGFGCQKNTNDELYNTSLDKKFIFGYNYGDEHEYFVNYVDILIRIGGNKKIEKIGEMFRKKITNENKNINNYIYEVNMKDIDIFNKKKNPLLK